MEQNPRQEDETIDVIGSGIDLDTDPPVQISDDDYDIFVPIINVDEELVTTLQEHINPLDDDGIMGWMRLGGVYNYLTNWDKIKSHLILFLIKSNMNKLHSIDDPEEDTFTHNP